MEITINRFDYGVALERIAFAYDCEEDQIGPAMQAFYQATLEVVHIDDKPFLRWYGPDGNLIDHFDWACQAWAKHLLKVRKERSNAKRRA